MKPRIKVKASIRLDTYAVLSRVVEEGVGYGLRRAYKYSDVSIGTGGHPTADSLSEKLEHAVMTALCEILTFEDSRE